MVPFCCPGDNIEAMGRVARFKDDSVGFIFSAGEVGNNVTGRKSPTRKNGVWGTRNPKPRTRNRSTREGLRLEQDENCGVRSGSGAGAPGDWCDRASRFAAGRPREAGRKS